MIHKLRWSIAVAAAILVGCSKQPSAASSQPAAPPRVVPIHVPYGADASRTLGITQSLRLPWSTVIQLGVHGGLEIEDESKTNRIAGGEATLRLTDLPQPGLERSIQIVNFNADESTVLVQVEVGLGSKLTILDAAPEKNDAAPVLSDSSGNTYAVVGFVYSDETVFKLRFTPNEPITRFNELPSLSRSRPKQKMVLLFRVSLRRDVKSLTAARVVYELDTPIRCTMKQENRR